MLYAILPDCRSLAKVTAPRGAAPIGAFATVKGQVSSLSGQDAILSYRTTLNYVPVLKTSFPQLAQPPGRLRGRLRHAAKPVSLR